MAEPAQRPSDTGVLFTQVALLRPSPTGRAARARASDDDRLACDAS